MSYVNIQSWTSSSCILCAPHPPCGHDDSAYPYTRGYPRPTDLAKATRGSEPRRSRSCGGLFFTSWMVGCSRQRQTGFPRVPPPLDASFFSRFCAVRGTLYHFGPGYWPAPRSTTSFRFSHPHIYAWCNLITHCLLWAPLHSLVAMVSALGVYCDTDATLCRHRSLTLLFTTIAFLHVWPRF